MSKQRRTVSLESEVDEYLSQSGTNASELVNELVKQHMNGGASTDEILEFRIQQVESELENLSGQLERKENELTELQERREANQEQQTKEKEEEIKQIAKHLSVKDLKSTGPYVSTSDEVVEKEAEKLGITADELRQAVIDIHNGEYDG